MSHRYLYLFLSQLALVFIYPALQDALTIKILLEVILFIALIGGVLSTITNRERLIVALVLGIAFLATRWLAHPLGSTILVTFSSAAGAVFFLYIATVIILHIFTDRQRVDADLIVGSISVYLLLGVAFGFAYITLGLLAPESFGGLESTQGDPDAIVQPLIYFSFVTLTTLGYGDITPLSQQAGVLAYMEAITGQIYLTVLVARLVGIHIAQSSSK